MRLINCSTVPLRMEEFITEPPHPYAILSHTWQDEEVTFQDFSDDDVRTTKKGWSKVQRTCQEAQRQGYSYVWVDSCCIDKTSSAELTESINSMFQWYNNAAICLVFLSDFDPDNGGPHALRHSRWFSRGWTLQELVAAKKVTFYDSSWNFFGTRDTLCDELVSITHISEVVLSPPPQFQIRDILDSFPIARRMSWAAHRSTKKPEDIAYCLIGIFGVNMPLLYGEGKEKAFIRLQEEIIRDDNDLSIFAWRSNDRSSSTPRGIMVHSPLEFEGARYLILDHDVKFNPDFSLSNKGLRIQTILHPWPQSGYRILPLRCRIKEKEERGLPQLGIFLLQVGASVYVRVNPHTLAFLSSETTGLGGDSIFVAKQAKAKPSLSALEEGQVDEASKDKIRAISLRFHGRTRLDVQPTLVEAEPKQMWNAQHHVFFTGGLRNFTGFARYTAETANSQGNVQVGGVVAACGFTDAGVMWVAVDDEQGELFQASLSKDLLKIAKIGPAKGNLESRKQDVSVGRSGFRLGSVRVNCEQKIMNGDPVLIINLDFKRSSM